MQILSQVTYGDVKYIERIKTEYGDTMTGIALKCLKTSGWDTSQTAILKFAKQIGAANNVANINYIPVGATYKIPRYSASSSGDSTGNDGSANGNADTKDSSSTSGTYGAGKAKITAFGLQSGADSTLYAIWDWSQSHTENYQTVWHYYTKDKKWFVGNDSTTTHKQSTYQIPSNAIKVRFKVKPISTKYTEKETNEQKSYWTATATDWKTYTVSNDLSDVPPVPSVEIVKTKLTAKLSNLKLNGTHIEFQIYDKNNKKYNKSTLKAAIKGTDASISCTITAGGKYKVRCRQVRGALTSEWSDFSDFVVAAPAASKGIITLKAIEKTVVQIDWENVSGATEYEIQYTTKKTYFDSNPDEVTSKTVDGTIVGHAEISDLTPGSEYFFRVRVKNEHPDPSPWTAIKSIILGTKPIAPTTWSSTTTAIVGDNINLYWVHNTEDGSSQKYAQLELYLENLGIQNVPGVVVGPITIQNSTTEELKDKTSVCGIDTKNYILRWSYNGVEKTYSFSGLSQYIEDGATIKWRVKTSGITNEYGDWSVQRTVDIYAPPTLDLSMVDADGNEIDTLESFPFHIKGLAGPPKQEPIGYHIDVVANETYDAVDSLGNNIIVNEGDTVYSKYFDISGLHDIAVTFSAGNIDLQNGVGYKIVCTAAMDSGLTVESALEFTVSWEETYYIPNAEIAISEDEYVAYIRPYCEDSSYARNEVSYDNTTRKYTVTDTLVDVTSIYIEELANKYTTTGEQVYQATTKSGREFYMCYVDSTNNVDDVLLSVYRREYDGSFTEIASDIDNVSNTTITDPHPSLDYARYRIVATSQTTGAVSYYDVPGYPVNGKAVVIQWDEAWSSYDSTNEALLADAPWSGSILKLPYDIDVSDNNSIEVEHVKYIGRKHPVSYYGTQVGETSSWSVSVPKDDVETIYALRRLAKWMGDVYVREPSGTGYWATVAVSFNLKHCETVVPVSLQITRVEGGI